MIIKYKDYLHNSKENNWELLGELEVKHNFILEEEQQNNFVYNNYEVELDMELDTTTGEAEIVAVNGRKLQEDKA